MYRDFYRLAGEPFQVTPDPQFLFLTDQYREGLAAIIYGIAERKGFICITGEVGVGKTTILRSYLQDIDREHTRFVYVFNPNLSFATLLRTVLRDLDLPDDGEPAEMVERLHEELIQAYTAGVNVVLFIDEAQNMPVETMENLRMLSNLETATEKLLQIVLVGQPELEAILDRPNLRQLKSRIAIRTRIGPMDQKESLAYIHHRINQVALDSRPLFADRALGLIVRHGRGIPRNINILADNALIAGFAKRERPVSARTVREVLRDLTWSDEPPPFNWRRSAAAAGLAGLLATGGLAAHELAGAPSDGLMRQITALFAASEAAAPAETEAQAQAPEARSQPPPAPPPQRIATEAPEILRAPVEVASLPPLWEGAAGNDGDIPAAEGNETEGQSRPDEATATEAADGARGGNDGAVGPPPGNAVRRTVSPGDTLFTLMMEVYGTFDREHVVMVQKHNPTLTDIDRLDTGQVIVFPRPDAETQGRSGAR